jgi:hypothetical protein
MLSAMNRRVLVAIALAPTAAHADPFVMPAPALAHEASISVDHTAMAGDRGVAIMLGYRRPVAARVAVTADLGVQGASRAEAGGWSLANVTVGGLYLAGATSVRLAATFPLASDGGDAAIPGALHELARVPDAERFAARTGALLLAGGRRLDRRKAFAQVELGALALIRADRPDELRLRLGLAGGVRVLRRVTLVGELTTVSGILSGGLDVVDDEPSEDFRHALDLGAKVALPRGVIGARLEVPLDAVLRDRDAYLLGIEYRVGL